MERSSSPLVEVQFDSEAVMKLELVGDTSVIPKDVAIELEL